MPVALRNRTIVKKKTRSTLLNLYSYKVPNIVIVGDKEIRKKIKNIEKNFNILLIFADVDELVKSINSKTIAVIVDEKKVKYKLKDYLEVLLKTFTLLPIFYLSREDKKPNFYSSLYDKGLQGVIKWPKEAKNLHDLLIESLRPHPKATGKTKGDQKLSEMVKSHLVLNGNYKMINVNIIEGFAFLEGRVKSLYDKELITLESSKVLGVKKVISKNVKIKILKNITDKEIEKKIKMYIKNLFGSKKCSINVKVKNKVVTLLGAVSIHNGVLDIERFSMKQPGVQAVIKNINYAPSLVKKNVKKAKLLEAKIKNLFEGAKHISISIYGEYAEVAGTVKMPSDRSLIEAYIIQILPVKKIINKLIVSGN